MTAFKPPSEWTPPDVFPTELLTNATQVAIDIETRDPNLKEKGPGFTRGDGEIVGISSHLHTRQGLTFQKAKSWSLQRKSALQLTIRSFTTLRTMSGGCVALASQ